MAVENPRYDSPLHEAFFEAASTQGIHYNPDFNDFERPQTGFGEFQVGNLGLGYRLHKGGLLLWHT
jgi:hypothetical protein